MSPARTQHQPGLNAISKKEERPVSVRSAVMRDKKYSEFIRPMLASLTDQPFDNPDWIFELKWDGYRAIAEVGHKPVKLYSRNGLSFAELYPSVINALNHLNIDAVLDGEIVVLDKNGKPSFQKLQHYSGYRSLPLVYYVFDCLFFEGRDLRDLPLLERKKILKEILPANDVLKYSDHVEASGKSFFKEAVKLNIEGILAKQANSLYETGKRTTNWLKIKNHNTQEAIIAGYTAPRASRKYFGALILGRYKNKKLVYLGHTGTGYTDKVLKEVYSTLQPMIRETSPFDEKVPLNDTVTWVEPKVVCNVKYTELTDQGIMRHPVFMGLRIDKPAQEVNMIESKRKTAVKAPSKVKPVRKAKAPAKNPDAGDSEAEVIKANGHDVALTNQQKIYWPDEGYSKGDVIDYYNKVSDFIIPYLKDRPQSLRRNPNGIKDKGFFHKDAGGGAPSWVKRVSIYAESSKKDIQYILCNDRATLLYLNNLGCIEINPWNSRVQKPDQPDYLILDIDPSPNNTFEEVIDVAQVIKEVLDKAGATGYCKTSGATGMHVYVPLHASYTYEKVRPFAELVATIAAEQLPEIATLERSLAKRKNRIYVDYLQNSKGQTLSSVYSLRPVPGATVSTPLLWKEVKRGLSPLDFNIKSVHARLKRKGDLFSAVLTEKINLTKCIKNLESKWSKK